MIAGTKGNPSESGREIDLIQVKIGGFTFDVRTAGPADGEAVILLHVNVKYLIKKSRS